MSNLTIGSFQLMDMLGEGGLGKTYLAIDRSDARNHRVAFKLFHPNLANNPQFRARFDQISEALAPTKFQHGQIAQVIAYRATPGELYISMDYIQGGNLGAYLPQLLSLKHGDRAVEALRLGQQMAYGLGYAHQHSIFHLNLKPSNILMNPAQVGSSIRLDALVTDFGTASLAASIPGVETLRGNLAYLSPEQCRGDRVDARADLYALGALIYEIASGQPPFRPTNFSEAQRMHTREEVMPLSRLMTRVPPELEQIVLRCLAKSPNDRPQSARQVAEWLQNIEVGPLRAIPTSVQPSPLAAPAALKTQVLPEPVAGSIPSYTGVSANQDDAGRARILFSRQNQPPAIFRVEKNVILIGRDPTSDLPLDGVQVSRHHARLDRLYDGRFSITDLGTTNGVWFGTSRCPANTPQTWQPGQVIRVGEYWLKLEVVTAAQAGVGNPAAGVHFKSSPDAVIPATGQAKTNARFALSLLPASLSLAPGDRAILKAEVENKGEQIDQFRLDVRGIPPEWVTLPAEQSISPKQKGTFQITLHPPRNSASTVGTTAIDVIASSRQSLSEEAVQPGQIVLSTFHLFTTEVIPKRLRPDGSGTLEVRNSGNARDSYNVSIEEQEGALDIRLDQAQVTIEPGQVSSIPIHARPRSRPFVGSSKDVPFKVMVKSLRPGGETQQQLGVLRVMPTLPYWALGALGFTSTACIVVGLVALFAIIPNLGLFSPATSPTPLPGMTPPAGVGTPTLAPGTDTDQDGLPDTQEINSYNTNPNNQDTDADGLRDGVEVNTTRTNPTNPDTDGDGIPDGADPNPLVPSTATPDVLATQTAAQGQIGATDAVVTQTALAGTQAAASVTQLAQTAVAAQTAQAIQGIAISINDRSLSEGTSTSNPLPSTAFVFRVSVSRASKTPIIVNYNTIAGSAVEGVDFLPASGTVTIQPDQLFADFVVQVPADAIPESNKSFTVVLSNPVGGVLAKTQGTGTILDDDAAPPLPQVSIGDASATEGAASINFPVTLFQMTTNPITINYFASEQTATEPEDYVLSGTVSLPLPACNAPPCVTSLNIPLGPGDTTPDATKTFIVTILDNPALSLVTRTATGTILDNDVAPALPEISISDGSATEGNVIQFTVRQLTGTSGSSITLTYFTADGTARSGIDYTLVGATTDTFPTCTAPCDAHTISVTTLDTPALSGNRVFTVNLANVVGATVTKGIATGTVIDDDFGPILISIDDVSVNEGDPGDPGTSTATFTVSLSTPNPGPGVITVFYETRIGTAVGVSICPGNAPFPFDRDFQSQSGTLVFNAGVGTRNIVVTICRDDDTVNIPSPAIVPEPSEIFTVHLDFPTGGANIADGLGVGTIIDS